MKNKYKCKYYKGSPFSIEYTRRGCNNYECGAPHWVLDTCSDYIRNKEVIKIKANKAGQKIIDLLIELKELDSNSVAEYNRLVNGED